MRPSTLWRYRGPLLRWGVFILMLAAVAAGLYVMLPAEPRWERTLEAREVLNAGGGRIATLRKLQDGHAGPLDLLDADTGIDIAQLLSDAPTCHTYAQSDDGRHLIALAVDKQTNTRHIRGVDLHERREWRVETPVGPSASAIFSPRCDYVALQVDGCYVVRRTADGHIVARVPVSKDIGHVEFSGDGGRFIVACRSDKAHRIQAVNTRTGQAITLENGGLLAVAPDSGCAIAACGDDGIWVADLGDGSWRCRLAGASARTMRQDAMRLATTWYVNRALRARPRRRTATIGYTVALSQVVSRGIDWIADVELGTWPHSAPKFTPDGRYLLWRERRDDRPFMVTLYDVRTGTPRWQRTWTEVPSDPSFTPDSRHVLVPFPNAERVDMLDAATGVTERSIALPGMHGERPRLSADGRTLTIAKALPEPEPFWLWAKILEWLPNRPEPPPLMRVAVYDFETGAQIGDIVCEETNDWWLTDDRSSLITVYHESEDNTVVQTVICGWDLRPGKPLRWIIGVPLALGVGLMSLVFGWRRWRRSRRTAGSQGTASCA
jgi:hypothetical protein